MVSPTFQDTGAPPAAVVNGATSPPPPPGLGAATEQACPPPPGLEFLAAWTPGLVKGEREVPLLGLDARELEQALRWGAGPCDGSLVAGVSVPRARVPSVRPDDAPAKVPVTRAEEDLDATSGLAGVTVPPPGLNANAEVWSQELPPPPGSAGLCAAAGWHHGCPAKVVPGTEGDADLTDPWAAVPVPLSEQAPGSTDAAAQAGSQCRWHKSANTVGVVSADGHIFTKTAGCRKVVMSSRGTPMELSSICMVFDESLRKGGLHRYHYQILDGELGVADGAGFVFDTQVRRNNIQRMRSVFLNQRGCVCLRDRGHVSRLGVQLPPLGVGMWLIMQIDLDSLYLQFHILSAEGYLIGAADVSLDGLFHTDGAGEPLHSGFFCAVVTRDISVALA